MAISTGTLSVPDFIGAEQKLKTLNDSADGSRNPAHPQLNAAGAIINPATAENQDAANAALGTIATATSAGATAAKQDTGNDALAAIATNTLLGSLTFTAFPTVTAGAYSAGMVVGGKITVPNAARSAGGSGLVQQALVGKKTALTAPFDLLVFHTDPVTAFTDHAPLPDWSADLGKLVGTIRCTDLVDGGTPQVQQALQQALQFRCAGTTLYVVAVVRGAETYASTDAVTVSLGILRD
ncbi:hypothetical protein GobsT_50760 [Gemmata obscuriglobus]|uniref:Uncharacterized protein n=1 Tax=Gemmata obscuriglobus TaxID=114 RepID=A0A2Z3GYA9_9BACT|nr:hypothetical protein [Gemmata obscuriglobus]AWM37022.1 hypothetical protein C1280_08315 [Gemmata obscuriglobus]QEG30272.1 hypothetical protein GobsT_50760 [Gemmata obscuriglobus]VTS09596.1 Uncharacterized protein OS=Novosphingobium nitrogenifigens DSM 19370 GN=Y88_0068 PE=4 SV=1 [Gemmata obscuriglobus UQM 2246]